MDAQQFKDKMKLTISEILAKQEAALYGYEITKCDIMWKSWTFLQKAKWQWFNKITSQGERLRNRIDEANKAIYELATDEELEDGSVETIQYPWYVVPDPKTRIVVETKIKLVHPIKYIMVDVKLED